MACVECGRDLGPAGGAGRPRRYCSRSCQSRAYRRRRDQGRLAAAGSTQAPGLGPDSGLGYEHSELVQAAVALADADGVDAVTLRAVAHRARVPLIAARRAFGSRDRLVATLVQQLLVRPRRVASSSENLDEGALVGGALVEGVPVRETPVRTLARLAEEEWVAYREHPWLVSVLASSRPPLVPAVLDAARASTEAFAALGLDPPSALGRYIALSGYVQGMALLLLAEHNETARSGTAYRAWWSEEARRLDRTGARRRHPWLDVVSDGRLPDSFDVDAWFRDGLDLVLAGLTEG